MKLLKAIQKLELLKQLGFFQNAIFIHCRGSDLVRTFIRKIRIAVIVLLQYLKKEFPYMHFILSLILFRRTWRYSDNAAAME